MSDTYFFSSFLLLVSKPGVKDYSGPVDHHMGHKECEKEVTSDPDHSFEGFQKRMQVHKL